MRTKIDYKNLCAKLINNMNDYESREKVKQHNRAMGKLVRILDELEQQKVFAEGFLKDLLQDEEEIVRRISAVHCLELNLNFDEAVRTLKEIKKTTKNEVSILGIDIFLERVNNPHYRFIAQYDRRLQKVIAKAQNRDVSTFYNMTKAVISDLDISKENIGNLIEFEISDDSISSKMIGFIIAFENNYELERMIKQIKLTFMKNYGPKYIDWLKYICDIYKINV